MFLQSIISNYEGIQILRDEEQDHWGVNSYEVVWFLTLGEALLQHSDNHNRTLQTPRIWVFVWLLEEMKLLFGKVCASD